MLRLKHSQTQLSAVSARRGFTLIELLVVIVVIVILIGLLLPAIGAVRTRVRQTQVQAELARLSAAVTAFKVQYGIEPPSTITICENPADYLSNAETRRSLSLFRQIWPQFNPQQIDLDGDGNDDEVHRLQAGEAIVLFLGGYRDHTVAPAGQFFLVPFAANAQNPFMMGPNVKRTKSAYDFDASRLVDTDNNGWPEYLDPLPSQRRPILYFSSYDASGYRPAEYAGAIGTNGDYSAPRDVKFPVLPYVQGSNPSGQPFNKSTYQLISPGFDGEYGPFGPFVPDGSPSLPAYTHDFSPVGGDTVNISAADRNFERDNITNFSQGVIVP